MNSQPGKGETGQRANGGEQKRLGEHLAGEMPPACADGRAHGEFAFAQGRPHQQKVGHVGAGDEQEKNYCAHKRQNGGPDLGNKMLPHELYTNCVAGGALDQEVLARFCCHVIGCCLRAF